MRWFTSLALTAIAISSAAYGKVSQEEAAKIGNTLTPTGGIKAGNADGSIPAWNGGITSPPKGYKKSDVHQDPFSGDQPRFTITAQNLQEHKDKLSPGQLAMFQRYPKTWRMPVYETRRTASYPQFVYDALKDNAAKGTLTEGGNGVANCRVSSPFPIPQNGLEAIWNHLLRYRGEHLERVVVQAVPTSGGDYSLIYIDEKVLLPYNDPTKKVEEINNRLGFFLQEVTAPAYLAGQILLVHETLNQNTEPRMAWTYNPGQRRVRRAPNVAYDNPGTASDSQRTTDQFDMFNGSPERYNWKLVGRKEMYIPYNAYRLHSKNVQYAQILQPGHMNPLLMRYELHRVWEVEATLKEGTSHIYAKRVFFLDEDSWQIVAVDQYDSRGQIWRVSEAHPINYYEVPLLWDTAQVHYDLLNGRYLVFGLNNQQGLEDFDVKLSEGDFTPGSLRRAGRR